MGKLKENDRNKKNKKNKKNNKSVTIKSREI